MGIGYSTTTRTARLNALVTEAGASAKLKFYDGTQPATGGTATTLLATLTFGANIGSVTSGVLTLGSVSQTNANHVAGTPTWVRLTKSDDTFVADINIGSGGMTFSGTIATGVDITLNASTITEGNA
jgi:hypothetical protein